MRRGESLRAASSLGSRDLNHDSYDVYRMQRPDTARETLGLGEPLGGRAYSTDARWGACLVE